MLSWHEYVFVLHGFRNNHPSLGKLAFRFGPSLPMRISLRLLYHAHAASSGMTKVVVPGPTPGATSLLVFAR